MQDHRRKASKMRIALVLAFIPLAVAAESPGKHREEALVQTWSRQLDGTNSGSKAEDTPVTRVTNLLKELMAEMKADMKEDEELHCKLMEWCSKQEWEKGEAIADAEAKIKFLGSEIERLSALIKQLEAEIADLTAKLKALKEQLISISTTRDEEAGSFKKTEDGLIAAIENLRAAIIVLSKHSGQDNLPDVKTERDAWSLLDVGHKDAPWWGARHESKNDRDLDQFMLKSGVVEDSFAKDEVESLRRQGAKFLQQGAPDQTKAPTQEASNLQMSAQDSTAIKKALATARAYAEQKGRSTSQLQYTPGYVAQSGEILGILKQMYEEMKEKDLAGAQTQEKLKIKTFTELRNSILEQIKAATELLDRKEDELAQAKMDLANTKEELTRIQIIHADLVKYMTALKKMCAEAQKNFDLRKAARMEEIKAVSETITILMDDDARDSFAGTYGEGWGKKEEFLQMSSEVSSAGARRKAVVRLLKDAATKTRNPALLALVTKAENDAFKPVLAAIDKMIAILDKQQTDERAQMEYCTDAIQENQMVTMEKETLKKDLEAKIQTLELKIKQLAKDIASAKQDIVNLESDLQRANVDRQSDNLEFQKTVANQRATIEVLEKALDKLATYYDGKGDSYTIALQTWRGKAGFQTTRPANAATHNWQREFAQGTAFVQVSKHQQPEVTSSSSSSSTSSSTSVSVTVGKSDGFSKVDTTAIAASGSYTLAPSTGPVDLGAPVAIKSFKPNKGAGGVMQFIEKLIYDAKELEAQAIASEQQAQAQYEAVVEDTNVSVAELQKSIVEMTAALAQAKKDKIETEGDLFDVMKELEDLSKYAAKLHEECDYYTKNFAARQEARGLELQALHSAKAILGGAAFAQVN